MTPFFYNQEGIKHPSKRESKRTVPSDSTVTQRLDRCDTIDYIQTNCAKGILKINETTKRQA